MLRQLSGWVLQSRYRLMLAVAFLLIAPLLNFVAPMVAVAGVLQFGPLAALPWIAGGWGLVGLLEVYVHPDPMGLVFIANAAPTLLIAIALGALLGRCRSLTLTLQGTLVGIAIVVVALCFSVDDIAGHWTAVIDTVFQASDQSGATVTDREQAEVRELLLQWSPYLTGLAGAFWFIALAISLLGGYAIWDHGGDAGRARFGRFRDLNLGRVVALLLVLLAFVGTIAQWLPAVNAAIVLLLAFCLHTCALAHWVRRRFEWPEWSLVLFYATLVLSPALPPVFVAICVAGYVDAWFNMVRAAPPGAAR